MDINEGEKMIKFACPYCSTKLEPFLQCNNCGFVGEIKNKHYHLHRYDETWQECLGQIEAAKKADIKFKEVTPVLANEETIKGKNINDLLFNKTMEILGNINNKEFLEIGGQTGWATKRFIEKGAGLGINLEINEEISPPTCDKYIAVVGDGYYLPFTDNQFDFVFDSAALHHFEDKPAILKQVHRVLKDDGLYMSQANPPRMGEEDDDRKRYMDNFGLIETMPTQKEYESYFMEVFGNINFVNVEINMVMWAKKKDIEKL